MVMVIAMEMVMEMVMVIVIVLLDWIFEFDKCHKINKKHKCPNGSSNVSNLSPAFHGFSCHTTKEDAIQFLNENPVVAAYPDQTFVGIAQSVGAFISRVGANKSSQQSGNGTGDMSAITGINVLVVDSGIAPHPDLNIAGGRNFVTGETADPALWQDQNGHGTAVAGVIGAKDNDQGIVGIAPGIPLWAVRVLNANNQGTGSDIIAGLNWILQNKNVLWNGSAVVNISIAGGAYALLDTAVQNLLNADIVVVVGAGNNALNAINYSPARVADAITVGGTSPSPYYTSLWTGSNYGTVVDILAPATSITSTYKNSSYATYTGTSMSAPIVTGTVVLMLTTNTIAGVDTIAFPQNVRDKLIADSSSTTPTNYDGTTGSNPRITLTSAATTAGTTNMCLGR